MFNGFQRPKKDGGGGSNIKSIQSGRLLMTATSHNIAIASVDLSKSIVIVNFSSSEASVSDAQYLFTKGKLTSATNLNLTRYFADTNTTVYWQVIEFNNVKSLQTGELTLPFNTGSLDNLINVNNYTPNKAAVFISYTQNVNGSNLAGLFGVYVEKYSATQINIARKHLYFTGTVYWQLIEFN